MSSDGPRVGAGDALEERDALGVGPVEVVEDERRRPAPRISPTSSAAIEPPSSSGRAVPGGAAGDPLVVGRQAVEERRRGAARRGGRGRPDRPGRRGPGCRRAAPRGAPDEPGLADPGLAADERDARRRPGPNRVRSCSSCSLRPTMTGLRPARPNSMVGAYRPALTGSSDQTGCRWSRTGLEASDRVPAGVTGADGRGCGPHDSPDRPLPETADRGVPQQRSCGGRSPGSQRLVGNHRSSSSVGSTTQSGREEIVRF